MKQRTTLILEEAVMEGVRKLAHRRRTEMSRVVNELLSAGLRQANCKPPAALPELPRFQLGTPVINLADRDALAAMMEAE
jgi:hypothetical protein